MRAPWIMFAVLLTGQLCSCSCTCLCVPHSPVAALLQQQSNASGTAVAAICGNHVGGMQDPSICPSLTDMHKGYAAGAADMHNEIVTAEDNFRMLAGSRGAYECRKAYSVAYAEMALDIFLRDMPEDLPRTGQFLDRQVMDVAAQERALTCSSSNALQADMLERMLVEAYSKLNRIRCTTAVTYQPQPPRKRLPDKEQLKHDVLRQVSGMPNPPWEPAARDHGDDEEMQVHHMHGHNSRVASLQAVQLHHHSEAVSEGSSLLMAVAEDLFDKLLMEGVDFVLAEQARQ